MRNHHPYLVDKPNELHAHPRFNIFFHSFTSRGLRASSAERGLGTLLSQS